jgi:hypothetical protein
MVSYGSARSTLFSRELSDNAVMEFGKIYQADFNIEGYRTMLPGWENEVMFTLRDSAYRENQEITYMDIDSQNHTITVQYKLADTANATAMIAPMVIAIVFIVVAVLAIYAISLTINGGIKELSTVMTDNPLITPVVYGGLAIVGIAMLIYMKNQFSSSGSKSSD